MCQHSVMTASHSIRPLHFESGAEERCQIILFIVCATTVLKRLEVAMIRAKQYCFGGIHFNPSAAAASKSSKEWIFLRQQKLKMMDDCLSCGFSYLSQGGQYLAAYGPKNV